MGNSQESVIYDEHVFDPTLKTRLAGWRNGKECSLEEDVDLFARFESSFVNWRDEIEQFDDPAIKGLTPQQRVAVEYFRKKGGHINRWTKEKIEYVMRHGLIIFMEYEVRKDIFATIGTASSLSSTPYSGNPPAVEKVGTDLISYVDEDYILHPTLANIDLRDVSPIFELYHNADKVLYNLRTSTATSLKNAVLPVGFEPTEQEMEMSFMRKGYASRLKAEMFFVARFLGNEKVMMNIGRLYTSDDRLMEDFFDKMKSGNAASTQHNGWNFWYGLRQKYRDIIIPRKATMYWDVYGSSLDRAIDHLFFNPYNGLGCTGWDIENICENVVTTFNHVQADIVNGRHAPWGEI